MQPKPRITPEEYLALERKAETKSEYFNGEIFAMSGASPVHVLIVTNVVSRLWGQLRARDCTVYSTDLRTKVSATGLYTYPDVVVVCGAPRFDDDQADTLVNPKVIIEVLSKSTQDYDRGAKFEQYRTIESFTEYVLIAQDKPHVEHFVRQPDGRWMFEETNRLADQITLESLGAHLALADVYEKVALPAA
ncbi:MAG TPA: Uma2 family endonuclease [Candidatus Margulisiibacteriota bacterium]|nr:Uma2 family endonuclease [Candidatus Margulisiibacteriota bacterium]